MQQSFLNYTKYPLKSVGSVFNLGSIHICYVLTSNTAEQSAAKIGISVTPLFFP